MTPVAGRRARLPTFADVTPSYCAQSSKKSCPGDPALRHGLSLGSGRRRLIRRQVYPVFCEDANDFKPRKASWITGDSGEPSVRSGTKETEVCVGRHPENDSPFVQTASDPTDCDRLSACGTRAWRNLGNVLQIGAFVEMGLIRRVLLSVDQFGTSTISCMWPSSALRLHK